MMLQKWYSHWDLSQKEPQKEPEGEDEYGLGIQIEKWFAMPNQSSSAIIDRLKELSELSKQKNRVEK